MSTIDELNINLINAMKEKGDIICGLEEGNVPITMNDLINFCIEQNISLDTPILIGCPDGYFPLAYYHNGEMHDEYGNAHDLGMLVIDDGDF